MGDFFDSETGLPIQQEDNLESDFLSGKISLSKDEPVNLFDPISKKTIQADPSKLLDALNLGLKFETSEQSELRKFKNNPDNQGFIPAIKTFGAQLADEFLLGIPETGLDIAQGENSLEYKKRQITKEQNPIANFLGGTTGFGLSLMYGSPVWKGISEAGDFVARPLTKLAEAGVKEAGLKTFAKEAAANVVKYGTEGMILSTPTAIEESVLGDHETVAEALLAGGQRLVEGGAVGGAMGIAGTALSKTIKGAKDIFGDISISERLASAADQKKLKAAGFKQAEIDKIVKGQTPNKMEEAADFLARNDLVGFKKMTEGSEARLNTLQGIIKKNGESLQGIYNTLDDEGIKTFNPWSANVQQKVEQLESKYADPIDKAYQKQIEEIKQTLMGRGDGYIPFTQAQKLVTKIGKYAFPKGLLAEDKEAAQGMYTIIKDELEESVEMASKTVQKPEFSKAYSTLKKDISIAKQLEAPFEKAFARQVGNNSISLTDYLSAVAAAGATGSVSAMATGLIMNNLKRHYGDYVTYKLLEHAAYGVDAVESRLNKALDNSLGLSKLPENIKPASVNFLKSYLGDRYDNNDKTANLKAFQGDINAFMNDSNASGGSLSLLSHNYKEAAPKVSDALKAKAMAAVSYLAEQMPKAKNPYSGLESRTYKPTDFEIASFERKAQAVFDPMSVVEELRTGAITSDQIDALKAVYPSLYKAIQSKMIEKVNTNPGAIPHAVKNKALKLLGLNQDGFSRRTNTVQLQRNFRTNFKPKPLANSKIDYGSRMGTDIDRVMNR